MMKARDLMVKNVCVCGPGDSLNRAAQILWENDCGALPVVDAESRLVGIITDRDICMAAYTQGVPLQASLVSSAMSRHVYTCSPEDTVGEVERLMQDEQIRRVPVLSEWGQLVGILTLGDLVQATSGKLRKALSATRVAKTLGSIIEKRPPAVSTAAE
jgi:CBS domain-containing protein